MPSKKKATFVLTDRLPCDKYFDKLLGLVVADIVHPTQDYCPSASAAPLEADDIVDTDVSTFLSAHASTTFASELRNMFSVSSESNALQQQNLSSKKILTRRLPQQQVAFQNLLAKHREEVMALLTRYRGRGYMIVAFKTCVDGEIESDLSRNKAIQGQGTLPVSSIANAASHGTFVMDDTLNPSASARTASGVSWRSKAIAQGEQIFAIQYRLVKLKKHFLASGSSPSLQPLQTVSYEDGIFGDDDKDAVYEDDTSSEEEDADFDDEDFAMDSVVVPSEGFAKQNVHFVK